MKVSNEAEHAFHVWINKRQDDRRAAGEPWEHSLYEFKNLVQYLEYGHERIGKAFAGQLPATHQQCSHSPVEPIVKNSLRCCLGQEVTTCPILLSLRDTVRAENERSVQWYKTHLGKDKTTLAEEEIYRLMAVTCGWHIYRESTKNGEAFSGVDTSEGYHLDEGDRRFWSRVYESMSATEEGEI